MSISTYAELKTSIADFLNREDLTAVIPTFIALTEAKLKRRYKDFSALSDGNTSNWILTDYPDVYLYGGLMEAAPYLHEDERVSIWAQLYSTAVGTLRGTVNNADFDDYAGLKLAIGDWLGRADLDNAIPQLIKLAEAKLFRKFDGVSSLSNSTTTNWILQNHPDLYLYASLSEASPYIGADDRIQVWRALYDAEISKTRKPKEEVNFNNYDGLKAAIADWLERYDLDDAIPDFIQLAEARIKRRVRDITPLSDVNTVNWMLTNHPDVYLFGALSESAPYLGQDERAVLWQVKYDAAFAEVRRPDVDSGLSDYDGLKAAVADWINRPDIDDIIPELIRLAESKIMRDLRHWRQQRRVTTTLNEQFENLPSDFLQPINFYIDTNQGEKTLEFSSLGEINRRKRFAAGISGEPVVYTINSGQIEFIPAPDDGYPLTMVYYAKIPNLSADESVNWLLTYYPDIYLFGSLMQASSYLNNDERLVVWAQLYLEAVTKANQESEAALYSGPLVLRNK